MAPLVKVFAADHLLLARLSLLGEFDTVPAVLFRKRGGGASSSIESSARTVGLDGSIGVLRAVLGRELGLLKIALTAKGVGPAGRLGLGLWSPENSFVQVTRAGVRRLGRSVVRRVRGLRDPARALP